MTNPVRVCVGCASTDDHPRHVIALPDGNVATYHLDCHAIVADCESCQGQLADAPEGAKGDALRDYLRTTGPDADLPGWTAPADAPAPAGEKG